MNLLDIFESDFARDKWNKASDEREAAANRREAEMTARHQQGKEDMSGAIDRLEKHLNTPHGSMDEAGIGQDIVNKTEKMARATPPTPAGKVASTVKNVAKWLAGKGGPGQEGPTYEGANDIADRGEYDQEGDMAKDNIHTIVRNARELESILGDNDNLPEWVQDKLANIKGMMTAVSEYMQTQHERDHEEGTTIAEWKKETPWKEIPKSKSGRPVDPRGEVTHLSDVARRETERKDGQKKSSKEVAEHGGGIGPKQHWQDLMPEGYQDFNKVEPYAVCLAGKPVKKFDYYEEARRFHDNWKQKLYREGDMAKAEKITLMPLNLDEDRDPWKEKHFGPVEVIQKVFKVKADNGKSYNIKAETEQQAKETLQKHAPDANILSIKFVSNVMDEASNPAQQAAIAIAMKKEQGVDEAAKKGLYYYVNKRKAAGTSRSKNNPKAPSAQAWKDAAKTAKTESVEEAQTDYSKRRQRERDVDAGKPVTKPRQSKMTDYQKKRAQDKKDMELGEEKTRLDPKCWTGKKIGTPKTKMKGGVRVNNCVPAESVAEDIYMEEEPSPVESAIIRRIMVSHVDWLQKFGPEKVMQAAEEVAYNVGDVDEIGTSDVSAYVHEVGRILGAV